MKTEVEEPRHHLVFRCVILEQVSRKAEFLSNEYIIGWEILVLYKPTLITGFCYITDDEI